LASSDTLLCIPPTRIVNYSRVRTVPFTLDTNKILILYCPRSHTGVISLLVGQNIYSGRRIDFHELKASKKPENPSGRSRKIASLDHNVVLPKMKLTLLLSLYLSLLQWPSLAFAVSLLTASTASGVDQVVSQHEGPYTNNVLTVRKAIAAASSATDRLLQITSSSCETKVQRSNTIVFELQYDSTKCLTGLGDNAIIKASDPLLAVH